MDYSSIFSYMYTEIALVGVAIAVLLYDLLAGERGRKFFHCFTCILMLLFIAGTVVPYHQGTGEVFGGMYVYSPVAGIVKSILAIGTLIVFLQADSWLRREDTTFKRGEFYVLTLSTLLGMDFMISSGHFMMFFIGLELASVPMACLVAFDKYRHNSAEAGAKYILSALFASGLMLYGISFLYGTTGTLYSRIWLRLWTEMPCRFLQWCSSSPAWASKSPSYRSTVDGRHIRGGSDHRHVLSFGGLQGCSCFRADGCSREGVRADG